jgi:hypothetical protein
MEETTAIIVVYARLRMQTGFSVLKAEMIMSHAVSVKEKQTSNNSFFQGV